MDKATFLRDFKKEHLAFFTRPLPVSEDLFDFGYSCATMAWIPMRRDIEKYQISGENLNKLDELFQLAESFLYVVKSSNNYVYAPGTLQQHWEKIQNLASTINI